MNPKHNIGSSVQSAFAFAFPWMELNRFKSCLKRLAENANNANWIRSGNVRNACKNHALLSEANLRTRGDKSNA